MCGEYLRPETKTAWLPRVSARLRWPTRRRLLPKVAAKSEDELAAVQAAIAARWPGWPPPAASEERPWAIHMLSFMCIAPGRSNEARYEDELAAPHSGKPNQGKQK